MLIVMMGDSSHTDIWQLLFPEKKVLVELGNRWIVMILLIVDKNLRCVQNELDLYAMYNQLGEIGEPSWEIGGSERALRD
jgi:hypothetical protein